MQETWVPFLGQEDPPPRRKWLHTPIFLPGKSHGQGSLASYIQSMGLQRVRHVWVAKHSAFNAILKRWENRGTGNPEVEFPLLLQGTGGGFRQVLWTIKMQTVRTIADGYLLSVLKFIPKTPEWVWELLEELGTCLYQPGRTLSDAENFPYSKGMFVNSSPTLSTFDLGDAWL